MLNRIRSASPRAPRLLVAERLEHALHVLGVVLVHLAAERGHVVARHRLKGTVRLRGAPPPPGPSADRRHDRPAREDRGGRPGAGGGRPGPADPALHARSLTLRRARGAGVPSSSSAAAARRAPSSRCSSSTRRATPCSGRSAPAWTARTRAPRSATGWRARRAAAGSRRAPSYCSGAWLFEALRARAPADPHRDREPGLAASRRARGIHTRGRPALLRADRGPADRRRDVLRASRRPGADDHFAYSVARDSRITVTLICPGYSSSCSISRAMSWDRATASSSSIAFGATITRISRPACIA